MLVELDLDLAQLLGQTQRVVLAGIVELGDVLFDARDFLKQFGELLGGVVLGVVKLHPADLAPGLVSESFQAQVGDLVATLQVERAEVAQRACHRKQALGGGRRDLEGARVGHISQRAPLVRRLAIRIHAQRHVLREAARQGFGEGEPRDGGGTLCQHGAARRRPVPSAAHPGSERQDSHRPLEEAMPTNHEPGRDLGVTSSRRGIRLPLLRLREGV